MSIEVNSDGLYIRYDNDQGKVGIVGSPAQSGSFKTIEVDFGYQDLNAHTVADDFFGGMPISAIPSGASIVEANLYITTGFDSGGSATLDLGLVEADKTAIDLDGIDAAIAETAIAAAGDVVACNGALVGGALLTEDAYLSYGVNVATFTVGQGKLVIKYFVPSA